MRRLLDATGRVLIAAGVLLLLFVAYQLWGTGLRAAQPQGRLESDFREALERVPTAPTAPATTAATVTTLATASTAPPAAAPPFRAEQLPADGEAAGRIEIPAIGLDWIFVRGVSVSDLKQGPGHYPDTAMPGQSGNAAIAGHRTTYGAPFNRIDELVAGDPITVTTLQGRFRYQVAEQLIVDPSQVEVLLAEPGRNTLTLTSCHPKYSASQRIIVRADLIGEPATGSAGGPQPDPESVILDDAEPSLDGPSLSGGAVGRWPTVLTGLVVAGIWIVTSVLARRWRRWVSYGLGLGPFVVALFVFFENVSRLLPANY